MIDALDARLIADAAREPARRAARGRAPARRRARNGAGAARQARGSAASITGHGPEVEPGRDGLSDPRVHPARARAGPARRGGRSCSTRCPRSSRPTPSRARRTSSAASSRATPSTCRRSSTDPREPGDRPLDEPHRPVAPGAVRAPAPLVRAAGELYHLPLQLNDERKDDQGIYGRGKSGDEGARPRAEGGSTQGGRGERRTREDRRDAAKGSRPGQADPRDRQSQRARPLAKNLVRDARRTPRTARSSASSKARTSSSRGTRRLASTTRRTSIKAPCGRPPSR